jgi:hypothetical protein
MLTGRVPFDSTSEFEMMKMQVEQAPQPPRTFTANIPIEIEQAIMRALAKKPEARFQTAGELQAMLLGALGRRGLSGALPSGRLNANPGAPSGPLPPVLKETRLGPNVSETPNPAYFQSGYPAAMGAELKETRLGQADVAPPPGSPVVPPVAGGQVQASRTSLLQRLNWKHFLAAGMAVVALASLPFALRSSTSTVTPPKAPAIAEPSSSPEAPPPPPSQDFAPSSNPVRPEENVVQPGQPIAGSEAPPPRSRSAGKSGEKKKPTTEPPATPAAAVETPKPQPSTPAPAQPQPVQPSPERPASAKSEEKKEEKKKGGIIGGIKKLGGKVVDVVRGEEKKKP